MSFIATQFAGSPVGMEMECPFCSALHVDEGEWAIRPHKTHRCTSCKREWRPFPYPTFGVLEDGHSFSVPFVPPSVNHYKKPDGRGSWFMTKEARAFIEAVTIFSNRRPVAGPFFHVDLRFYLPAKSFLKMDADNFEKVSFDALTIAGVIPDDRYVTRHTNQKLSVQDPEKIRTVYVIRGKKDA